MTEAVECDVDCVSDGAEVFIGGVIEHVEEAGIHSGDSAGVLPPHSLPEPILNELRGATRSIALELGVIGLMNVQFAVPKGGEVHVLEVNPRASRTVPFVSKATGVPLAKLAAKVMAGVRLSALGLEGAPPLRHVAIKESIFPFSKLSGTDTLLGPEMKSTGEIMGIAAGVAAAFGKTLLGAGYRSILGGRRAAVLAVAEGEELEARSLAGRLRALGFRVSVVDPAGPVEGCEVVSSAIAERALLAGDVAVAVLTARFARALRQAALGMNVAYFTTLRAANMAALALEHADANGDAFYTRDLATLQERLAGEGRRG